MQSPVRGYDGYHTLDWRANRRILLNLVTALVIFSFAGDIANGFLGTAETGLTVGKMIRGAILLLAALYLFVSTDDGSTIVLTVAVAYIAISILSGLLLVHDLNFSLEVVQAARILYTPVVSLCLISLLRNFLWDRRFADQLFVRISVVGLMIAGSVVVPVLLGIGRDTYGAMESFGSKGILLSQNEIALTLIIMQVLAAYHFAVGRRVFGALLVSMNGVALLFLGTRTAIVGSFAVPLVAFFGIVSALSIFGRVQNRGTLTTSAILIAMCIVAGGISIPIILNDAYLMAKFASILNTLNVRQGLLDAGLDALDRGSTLQLLVGQTATKFYAAVASSDLIVVGSDFGKRVEVDWVDVWGIYGLFFVIGIYFFYFGALVRHAVNAGRATHSAASMVLVIFLGHSVWAGHAIMAPMPGTVVAVIIALSCVRPQGTRAQDGVGQGASQRAVAEQS